MDENEYGDDVLWWNAEEINFEDLKSILYKNENDDTELYKHESTWSLWKPYIGVVICLISSILCGLCYPLKRYAITCMNNSESPKSSERFKRFIYVTDRMWLLGQLCVISGECLHYVAFYFTQAIVVCTIQMLTIIVSAYASSVLLGEKTNRFSRLGMLLALSGCWVITFNAPPEESIRSSRQMLTMLLDPTFMAFSGTIVVISLVNIFYVIPKYKGKYSIIYAFEIALLGSFIVICLKGLGVALTEGLQHWLPVVCLLLIIICVALQIWYTNIALEKFHTLMFTMQFYMSYSACTITSTTILYKLWKKETLESVASNIVGIITIILGVVLHTIFDIDDYLLTFSRIDTRTSSEQDFQSFD